LTVRLVRVPIRIAAYVWTSPTTMVGLAAGAVALGTGGKARLRRGVIEFHGGFIAWAFRQIGRVAVHPGAMTLGHVILGDNPKFLDVVRDHEQVHVRQAERWGPFFLPAYLAASAYAALRGGDAYRHNWFEREAYGDFKRRA
jgi:hypothetical protein